MASVRPLFINSDNDLQEMTDAQILLWQQKAIYQYSLNPSAELEVVSNSGSNMAAITDTRLQSGAAVTSVSSNPSASAGAPSATTDVSFDKIDFQYNTTVGQTNDNDNRAFPIFRNSDGDIQAMTLEDLKDTFLHPAINLMVVADASADDPNVAGTYRIHTASTLSDFTEVSGASASLVIEDGGTDGAGANAGDNLITEDDSHNLSTEPNVLPIFTDTTSTGFAATSIGAATTTQIGVASTVLNYYLMRRDGTDVDPVIEPLSINSDGDIQEYVDGESTFIVIEDGGTDGSAANAGDNIIDETNSDNMLMENEITGFATLLGNWLRFTAGQSADGFKITYAIGASVDGTQRGTSILNKQLGSATTSTTFVNANDYRAQQFPSGSATTTNTFLFKIDKA